MVVLATKVYVSGDRRANAMDGLESLVANALGDLEVDTTIGVRHDDFPTVTVDGPDAPAARNLLREEWGEIPPELTPGSIYRGTLESWDETGIVLDAGEPVRIERDALGLGPGDPGQLRDRFGLVQHVPLWFALEDDGPRLADRERDRLYEWQRGDGRVNVNSATRAAVRATLNRAGHVDDYVTVERLGLLEQSVVCAPGTDPPGLLASIGEYLQAELKCVVP